MSKSLLLPESVALHKILKLPTVKALTGLSRSSLYHKISTGDFPRSVSLGSRAVGWLSSDVQTWIADKVYASRFRRDDQK
jgi:prophage regulatory protein